MEEEEIIVKEKIECKEKYKIKKYSRACVLSTQTRTVTCYKTDPSSCQGDCPMRNNNTTLLTTAKIWS
jgi:hypothetical protein